VTTHDASTAPRRRSVHFVPGGNDRFLDKALSSAADTIVLDLEDSVPPDRKEAARAVVAEWLTTVEPGDKELMVRVNALGTPWVTDDIEEIVPLQPRSLMLPKVGSREDLATLDALTARHDQDGDLSFFPVATETAAAVVNLPELGHHPRVDGLCWGAEDLSAELGGGAARDETGRLLPVYVTVQSWCLLSARAAGVQAVDAVFTDLADGAGLRREAELAAAMGFDGKITIHPDQIEVVNDAFTPTIAAIEEAVELLAEYERARTEGRMAFSFRGQMVDAPHLTRARRLLGRAGVEPDGRFGR
jgi:citrate lyase subunit beta/citryl-CoA lyase